MVVNDEKDLVALYEKYLKKWNFESECYSDPAEALKAFRKNPDRYLLVMSDIRMPGMTGIAMAEEMYEINPTMRIIFITAFEYTASKTSHLARKMNPPKILNKPFQMTQLCTSTKEYLNIQCPQSSS